MQKKNKDSVAPHKLFNASARSLLRQMASVFPDNETVKHFQNMMAKATPLGPAMAYFDCMNCRVGAGGVVVGDMVLNKDSDLFSSELALEIPHVDMKALCQMWRQLSDENRETVWQYADTLAKCSWKVAAVHRKDTQDDFGAITEKMKKLFDTFPASMPTEQKVQAMLSDPSMADIAADVKKMLKGMGVVIA